MSAFIERHDVSECIFFWQVLYCSLQVSLPFQDAALGQPHNPTYLPSYFTDYKHPLTFMQRMKNAWTTFYFHFYTRYPLNKKLLRENSQ